eukprot:17804-Heterococcus_DN1.PRE.3
MTFCSSNGGSVILNAALHHSKKSARRDTLQLCASVSTLSNVYYSVSHHDARCIAIGCAHKLALCGCAGVHAQ